MNQQAEVTPGARNLAGFLTGVLFGHVSRMVEQGSMRNVWRLGLGAHHDATGQTFTMHGVGSEDGTNEYSVAVLVRPVGAALDTRDDLWPDRSEPRSHAGVTDDEDALSAEEAVALERQATFMDMAQARDDTLTLNDLMRVAWPQTDDAGWRVVLTASTATDNQFHAWARTRLPGKLGARSEPWPPVRRLSFCRHLWTRAALVLLGSEAQESEHA